MRRTYVCIYNMVSVYRACINISRCRDREIFCVIYTHIMIYTDAKMEEHIFLALTLNGDIFLVHA